METIKINPVGIETKIVDAQGNELVSVVRCKDCKYYEEYEEGKYWCWVGILGAAKPTDFCSYGKGKEDV